MLDLLKAAGRDVIGSARSKTSSTTGAYRLNHAAGNACLAALAEA